MSTQESIQLTTGSRLHFGLFAGQSDSGTSFGGIGAMVDQPGLKLSICPAEERQIVGPQADRLTEFVDLWFEFTGLQVDQEFELRLVQNTDSHVGLGTGTQLGLGTSALLFQFFYDEVPSVEVLARSVKRGKRSAIGTYGFSKGGFLIDRGKSLDDKLAHLDFHCDWPDAWRFLLIRSAANSGLSGTKEAQIFDSSTNQMAKQKSNLMGITRDSILPAFLAEDFNTFAESIYQFGKQSGMYFSQIQGGPFNGPRITEIIEFARAHHMNGVGQSSWGPTVYALASSEAEANQFANTLSGFLGPDEEVIITRPRNRGFQIATMDQDSRSPQPVDLKPIANDRNFE